MLEFSSIARFEQSDTAVCQQEEVEHARLTAHHQPLHTMSVTSEGGKDGSSTRLGHANSLDINNSSIRHSRILVLMLFLTKSRCIR